MCGEVWGGVRRCGEVSRDLWRLRRRGKARGGFSYHRAMELR